MTSKDENEAEEEEEDEEDEDDNGCGAFDPLTHRECALYI